VIAAYLQFGNALRPKGGDVESETARVKKTAVAAFGNAEIDPSSLSRWAVVFAE
jgi:hypothetical protein